MEITFGEGSYIENKNSYNGLIVVDDFKIYLKEKGESLADTYIPLDKIERVRLTLSGVEIQVKLSASRIYCAFLKGKRANLNKLVTYLVKKLSLKKRFLKKEWKGEISFR